MAEHLNRVCPLGPGSTAKGIARLAGVVGLLVFLIPAHLIVVTTRCADPFLLPRKFHGLFMRILGFRVRTHGVMLTARPTFFVSNHSSYLDIPVLASVIPGAFIAKAEVGRWPFIGILAKLQNTVFIERRRLHAATQRNVLRERLQNGESLILFPEGTSSDGQRTLPFKSSLFSAVETPLPNGRDIAIQPVSVLCTGLHGFPIGRAWRPYYAWYADMTLMGHFWRVFCLGCFAVDIIFHPPVKMSDFPDRKALSDYCQRQVARGVESCVKGLVPNA